MIAELKPTHARDRPDGDPPSRFSNPFSTCWTRPGATDYVTTPSASLDRVIASCKRSSRGVAIVGPHGSGKSTLLHSLRGPLERLAMRVFDGGVDTDGEFLAPGNYLPPGAADSVVLLEGFERLPIGRQRQTLRRSRQIGWTPIVTLHHRRTAWCHGLAVAAITRPDERILRSLFQSLTAERETPVTLPDALASYRLHGSDFRSIWFDLYNLHESRRRELTHRKRTDTLGRT